MFALAVELRRKGCSPLMAVSPNFQSRAHALGLESVAVGPAFHPDAVRLVMADQLRTENPVQQGVIFIRAIAPFMDETYRTLLRLCQNADILISTPYQVVASMVHETLQIPYVSIHLSPVGESSTSALKRGTADMINSFRRQIGLADVNDPLTSDSFSKQLALHAVSRLIYRPAAHWPSSRRVVGFFFLDEPQWEPPSALVEFVSQQKPIVVTFGSTLHEEPKALTELLLAAIRRCGQRALIQQGWSGLGTPNVSGDVMITGSLPHAWLFRNAACVIHHGGAGTTAAAFRAATPSVVVPHLLDQAIWGGIAHGLGCAGRPLSLKELTVDRLAEVLAHTLSTPKYATAAATIASKIEQEQGVKTAGELIMSRFSVRTYVES